MSQFPDLVRTKRACWPCARGEVVRPRQCTASQRRRLLMMGTAITGMYSSELVDCMGKGAYSVVWFGGGNSTSAPDLWFFECHFPGTHPQSCPAVWALNGLWQLTGF